MTGATLQLGSVVQSAESVDTMSPTGSWFKAGAMSYGSLPRFGNEESVSSTAAKAPALANQRPHFTFGSGDDSESEGEDGSAENYGAHSSAEQQDSGVVGDSAKGTSVGCHVDDGEAGSKKDRVARVAAGKVNLVFFRCVLGFGLTLLSSGHHVVLHAN